MTGGRTEHIEALRDASELVGSLADVVEQGAWDRLPDPLSLRSFSEHCASLAAEADDATLRSEHGPDDEPSDGV